MVAITKSFLLLLGATLAYATKSSLPVPMPSLSDISKELDCQAQCIMLTPPFGNYATKKVGYNVTRYMNVDDYGKNSYMIKNIQPIAKPCLKKLYALKGNVSKITPALFDDYVLCNSKTLAQNNDYYTAKGFNWAKNGFDKKHQAIFQTCTLPTFTTALHTCRGGCRRIHFDHKSAPALTKPKAKCVKK